MCEEAGLNGYGRGQKESKGGGIFTAETWGMVIVLFSFLCFVCLTTRGLIFGDVGLYTAYFLLGIFGYFAYAALLSFFYAGIVMVRGRQRVYASPKTTALIIAALVCLVLLIHCATSSHLGADSLKAYLKNCYDAGAGSQLSATGGGALFALFAFPIISLITFTGAYAFFAVCFAACFWALVKKPLASRAKADKMPKIEGFREYPFEYDFTEENDYAVKQSKKLHCRDDEFLLKTKKDLKTEDKARSDSMKILYPYGQKGFYPKGISYQEDYTQSLKQPQTPSKPVKIITDTTKSAQIPPQTPDFFGKSSEKSAGGFYGDNQNLQTGFNDGFSPYEDIYSADFEEQPNVIDLENYADLPPFGGEKTQGANATHPAAKQGAQDNIAGAANSAYESGEPPKSNIFRAIPNDKQAGQSSQKAAEPEKPPVRKRPAYSRYSPPPYDFFTEYSMSMDITKENFEENRIIIEETLKNFEIPAKVVNTIHGPTVTRYDIDIPRNIQSKRVMQYGDDIAMRLRSKFGVRIEQNPGEGVLAIEVPNNEKATVGLKSILRSSNFINAKKDTLTIGLGMDVTGSVITGDLCKMPHLLVAGSTGSGKSVCLNTLIISLITKYSPEDLRLILIDPKRVEFTIYNGLPHLVINEIICDSPKTIASLNWAIDEMERRYIAFNERAVRDIDEYNDNLDRETEQKISKIVIIVDELADLMTANKREIEDRIMKLTQKSRAAGIHLVLATQRPSVDIITGVIKTNLPSRIAFMVSSSIDSRTILDESGAEQLLGNGDMLYRTGNMKMPMRVQGAFISMKEVRAVVNHIKENNQSFFDEQASDFINAVKNDSQAEVEQDDENEVEQVYIDALRTVIQAGQASISMIQRKYPVGYTKAGKIIDWMESKGYISHFEGSKSRQVLLSEENFRELYGDI